MPASPLQEEVDTKIRTQDTALSFWRVVCEYLPFSRHINGTFNFIYLCGELSASHKNYM